MERITVKNLEAVVARINRLTGSPVASYLRDADGKLHAQIGNYHLDGAYGGYGLHRMVNEGGGIEAVISGYRPKRELYDMLFVFISGLETGEKKVAS